jgi:para-nitrobenzyl esterase
MTSPMKRITLTVASALVLLMAVLWWTRPSSAFGVTLSDPIQTSSGPVSGITAGETRAYLGVPYAAPPTGTHRYQPPQQPSPWTEPLVADRYPAACPQLNNGAVVGSEDCLYLNVWRPVTATAVSALPVLLFVHGGSNTSGSTADTLAGVPLYDGQRLVEQGNLLVVTIQYRLGALGFLAHPALAAEQTTGLTGNYALLDQMAALQWVQANIASFGGDPERVMLVGHSAGGLNVCALLASPLSAGLFSTAVVQSGPCLSEDIETRLAAGVTLADKLNCDTATCLREATITSTLQAMPPSGFIDGVANLPFGPTVDGYVLTQSPLTALATGEAQDVPLLVGANADEVLPEVPLLSEAEYESLVAQTLAEYGDTAVAEALARYPVSAYNSPREAFAAQASEAQFICPSRTLARSAASGNRAPVYRYFFTHNLSGFLYSSVGAFHGLELLYLFQNVDQVANYAPTAQDMAVEAFLSGDWTSFAGTGQPANEQWTAYDTAVDNYLRLDATPLMEADLFGENCDFWDQLVVPTSNQVYLPLLTRLATAE